MSIENSDNRRNFTGYGLCSSAALGLGATLVNTKITNLLLGLGFLEAAYQQSHRDKQKIFPRVRLDEPQSIADSWANPVLVHRLV